jgi:hypothetical protein
VVALGCFAVTGSIIIPFDSSLESALSLLSGFGEQSRVLLSLLTCELDEIFVSFRHLPVFDTAMVWSTALWIHCTTYVASGSFVLISFSRVIALWYCLRLVPCLSSWWVVRCVVGFGWYQRGLVVYCHVDSCES